MLINPFTPSEIASQPDDFFGRTDELQTLERSLSQGSVVVEGAIGIGKSSLVARARLLMEGFASEHTAKTILAVGHKGIRTVDEAARLLVEQFVEVDQQQKSVTFKLGSLFEHKSEEVCRNYSDGRHLAVLQRLVERETLKAALANTELLIFTIDEADKCPIPLAALIRAVVTQTQHQGVRTVRFIVSGVSPFFQKMVEEDPGIRRFFYKAITLEPMPQHEAMDLLGTKLARVVAQAQKDGIPVRVEPRVVPRIVALSGGHPHILQLLGSHLIEHENDDPDGTINARDLANSLRRICYEDRAQVYDATIHMLEMEDKLEALSELLASGISGFPTRIDRQTAISVIGKETAQWFVEHNVLTVVDDSYALVDEFLRIRMLFDRYDSHEEQDQLEREILRKVALPYYPARAFDEDL